MSKALLIIDMPEHCRKCPCYHCDEYDRYCSCTFKSLDVTHAYDCKPKWCPLIDIKERKRNMDPLEYVAMKMEEEQMKWLLKAAVSIFWIMDILNMPFMEVFDTVYPLNGAFWCLVFIFTNLLDWEDQRYEIDSG